MKIVLRPFAAILLLLAFCSMVFYVAPLWVNDQRIRLGLWREGVQSKYVMAGGYRVHYFEAKPAGGTPDRPLLLIHGLGSRGEDWATLITPLAASGFHVYAPDLLGFGRSPRPDVDYSIDTEEKFVIDFMQSARIPRADVGGWSMGGWVAAKLTLDHPELVRRLVMYDSVGIYFPPTFNGSIFTPRDEAGLTRLTGILETRPPKLPQFIVRAAIRRLQTDAFVVNRSVSQMMSGRDLLDFRLSGLRRPTLLVWGSQDALVPLGVGESMHRLIPGSSMTVIEGCGHLAPGQCWHSSLATTVHFLQAEPELKGFEQTLPGN